MLICCVTGFAQQIELDSTAWKYQRDMIFQKSSYIFQGTLINGEPAMRPRAPYADGYQYPYIKKIKITSIFKNIDGKLKLGTVQVIDYSRHYNIDEYGNLSVVSVSDGGYTYEDNGIYFCTKHDSTIDKPDVDNDAILLKQICGVGFNFQDFYDENHKQPNPLYCFRTFGLSYTSKADFYKEIKNYPNVTIPDSLLNPPVPVVEPVKYKKVYRLIDHIYILDSIPDISPQKKSPIENELKPVKPFIKIDTSSILNNIHIKASGANEKTGHIKHIEDVELTLQIVSATITGTFPFFNLDFDIYINANGPGYFLDNILMDFAYSPALGSNIAYSLFPNLNSMFYDPTADWTTGNISAQVFSLNYGSNPDSTSWTRNEIPTTPTQLFSFSIPVNTCTDTVSIGFTNRGSTALDNLFTNNFDDDMSDAIMFDATNYWPNDPYENLPCPPPPVITSFTDTLIAGDYYQNNPMNLSNMVIKGSGFEGAQGSGNVFFGNADNGGVTTLPLDGYDIQSWSDTMITLTVPGMIQSDPNLATPGGGTFKIKTNSNQFVSSTGVQSGGVYFLYSVLNKSIPTPYTKLRRDLGKIHATDTCITFLLDTSIINYNNNVSTGNPMLIPMIKKALADWVCETQVNFIIGGADSGHTLNPNYSLIYLVNTLPNIGEIAETDPAVITCTDAINTSIKYKVATGYQIQILRTPATSTYPSYFWWFDTLSTVNDSVPPNGVDLFQTLHHEFGHASGMGHITDNTDLMYYTQRPGPYQNWYRRWIKQFWNANGGIEIDRKSALFNNYSSGCSGFELPLASFSSCLPDEDLVPTINPYVFNLKMYPNPLNDNLLNITYTLKQDSQVTFEVLDITGREVLSINENRNAGKQIDQLNLDNISIGVYLIKIIIGDTQDTQKLVKIR